MRKKSNTLAKTQHTDAKSVLWCVESSSNGMLYDNPFAGGVYQVHNQTEPSDHPPLDFEMTGVLF